MSNWSEGYFTDSTYTFGYYRELSPNFIRWCLTLRGFAVPESDENSCHCELGFGQGVSANIHAAAIPGKFFGTDFNPAHAAQAQELAKASGADANFFEDSFEEFANRDDLPQFDTIGFHGIWSWVSDENRRHMLDVARKHLKSGGAVYCSYNCLPGWAPAAPLRELLRLHDQSHADGDTDKRVKDALNFIGEMIAAKPAYLELAPRFAQIFEGLKKHDAHYIAHEYLNLDWDLMYFTDVADMFREYKLDFAATALPIEALGESNFSQAAREFLGKITDPLMREQVRDYFVNRQFRKDLFVRGLRRLPLYETYERILETRYVLLRLAADVPLQLPTALGTLTLSEDLYKPLLAFLQEDSFRPKTFMEYLRRQPGTNPKDLVAAATILVDANQILPCQSESAVKRVKKSCERLNAHICERAKFEEAISFLASPLTGMGVALNRFQQLFLSAYKGNERSADGLAKSVWDILARQGQRIVLNGEKLEDVDKNLAHLKTLAENFLSKELPLFKALQL